MVLRGIRTDQSVDNSQKFLASKYAEEMGLAYLSSAVVLSPPFLRLCLEGTHNQRKENRKHFLEEKLSNKSFGECPFLPRPCTTSRRMPLSGSRIVRGGIRQSMQIDPWFLELTPSRQWKILELQRIREEKLR